MAATASVLGGQAAARATDARLVSGEVRDANGRAIPNATVELDGGFARTRTDADGRFTLLVPARVTQVVVRRLGFRAATVALPDASGALSRIAITLESAPEQLAGVLVPGADSRPMSLVATRQAIARAPPMIEPDALRALTFVPGVQQPNTYVGRMHVAGAALDESLITIDGHPLQSPMHVQGIGSGIAMAALDRVEVLAHHVPATTDTRAGGQVAMHSRRTDASRDGEFALSMLSASFGHVEPALPAGLDLLVAGRVTYMDRVMRRVQPGYFGRDQFPIDDFQDGLVRLGRDVGAWRVEALAFASTETENTPPAPASPLRAEYLGGLTLERRTGDHWTTVRLSHDLLSRQRGVLDSFPADGLRSRQRLTVVSVEQGVRLSSRSTGAVRLAFHDRAHAHRWASDESVSVPGVPYRYAGTQSLGVLSAAARIEHRLAPTLVGEVGSVVQRTSAGAWLAPRVRLSWTPSSALELTGSLERRHQFDGEYGPDLEIDRFSPLFLFARPRRLDGAALSAEWRSAMGGAFVVALRGDLYARYIADRPIGVVVPQVGLPDTTPASTLAFDRTQARAVGAGLGVTLTGPRGMALQAAYGASSTEQRTGRSWHRSSWDRPHVLTLLATTPRVWGWSLGATLVRQSGAVVTPLLALAPAPSALAPEAVTTTKPLLGEPNSARFAPDTRLDLALRRGWRWGRLEGDIALQLFNVRNDINPLRARWIPNGQEPTRPEVTASAVERIPSLGFTVRW